YDVNKGVAKAYEIQTYRVGDNVALGDATLKIKSVTYGEAEKKGDIPRTTVPCTVTMEITNNLDTPLDIREIVTTMLIYDKYDRYQTNQGTFDRNILQQWPAHKTDTFTLTYDVEAKRKGKPGKLYIMKKPILKLIEEQYKEGKRYGIVINF
ncbi:hypothetical protein M3215_16685, partial [Bacillus cytotoxicus]|nr:hypothetical protein [Bacillus cytotoxicus]